MLVYLRDESAQTSLGAAQIEVEVADQAFCLTQSLYTDNRPTSPSADPVTPGAWQDSQEAPIVKSLVWLDPEEHRRRKRGIEPRSGANALPQGQRGG